MPKKLTTLGEIRPDPNATIGDAINYAKKDPNAMIAAVKWLAGFFVALFKPAVKKPR